MGRKEGSIRDRAYVTVRVCIRNQYAGGRIRDPCIYTDTLTYVHTHMRDTDIKKVYMFIRYTSDYSYHHYVG